MADCQHLRAVTPQQFQRKANTPNGCEECLAMGDTWVHLRLCLQCGHVGCCDSSKNKHVTKHYHRVHHPVIRSTARISVVFPDPELPVSRMLGAGCPTRCLTSATEISRMASS